MLKMVSEKILSKPPVQVFAFYAKLALLYKKESTVIVATGFLYRLFTILLFVLIVKIFVLVINPASMESILKKLSAISSFSDVRVNENSTLIMLAILQVCVVLHYLIGKINVKCLIGVRKEISLRFTELPFDLHIGKRRTIALDVITIGYENFLKIIEIGLFFVFIIVMIISINLVLGIFVVLAIPLFILGILSKNRNDMLLSNKYVKSKEDLYGMSLAEYEEPINNSQILLEHTKGTTLFSQMVGGSIVVVMILLLFTFDPELSITGIWSLFLIFGVRYSISYAQEIGGVAGKLISTRLLLKPVLGLSFKDVERIASGQYVYDKEVVKK